MSHKNKYLEALSLWVEGEEVICLPDLMQAPEPIVLPTPQNILPPTRYQEKTMKERYHCWEQKEGASIFAGIYKVVAVVICVCIIAVLLLTVAALPPYGGAHNPVSNEVVQRYVEKGLEETGAVNLVAGMILDYRAFDTFGESAVLFIAVISVVMLLQKPQSIEIKKPPSKSKVEQVDDQILQTVAHWVIPVIFLLGIYIVLNGHLSPGGGFSGGAVMGAGLILYANAFGYQRAHRFFSFKTFTSISCGAMLVYAAAKGYSFFTGANHLPSVITVGTPGAILSGGLILPLNICVGLVVAGTMYCFYSLFSKGEV